MLTWNFIFAVIVLTALAAGIYTAAVKWWFSCSLRARWSQQEAAARIRQGGRTW